MPRPGGRGEGRNDGYRDRRPHRRNSKPLAENDLRHNLNARRQLPPGVGYVQWTEEGPIVFPSLDIRYPRGMRRQECSSMGSTGDQSDSVDQDYYQYTGRSDPCPDRRQHGQLHGYTQRGRGRGQPSRRRPDRKEFPPNAHLSAKARRRVALEELDERYWDQQYNDRNPRFYPNHSDPVQQRILSMDDEVSRSLLFQFFLLPRLPCMYGK